MKKGCFWAFIILIIAAAVFIFATPWGRDVRDLVTFGADAGKIYTEKPREYKSAGCMENLKLISQAMSMYLESNAYYPPAGRWVDELENVVPLGNDISKEDRAKVFKCPDYSAGYGYAMNSELSSLDPEKATDKAVTAVIFDADKAERNASDIFSLLKLPKPARHGDSNNVLFADGHVSAVINK